MISLPWFMCLFLTYIPTRVALRLLDWFFHDGSDVLLMSNPQKKKTKGFKMVTVFFSKNSWVGYFQIK